MLLNLLAELKIIFLDAGLLKSLERLKNSPELKREAQELFQILTQGTGKMIDFGTFHLSNRWRMIPSTFARSRF